MPCQDCTQTTAQITGFVPAQCNDVVSSPCDTDAKCITYTGPALSCANILTNDRLDIILQKIDPLLCASSGDYSSYDTSCLGSVTTEAEFVSVISSFVCTLSTDFDTFKNVTFPAYQTLVGSAFDFINNPGITCSSAGITPSDPISIIYNKYCTKFTQIDTKLDISSVNWSSCFSVGSAPTTMGAGFNTVISQICLLKTYVDTVITTGGDPLTFNNIGSCLPSPGAADSLGDTINKIKTRLCQSPTLDLTGFTWGCVTAASGSQNLTGTLQNIVTNLSNLRQNTPLQFTSDFVVTNVDNGNLCLGKRIALATPSAVDRFVAATASDTTPGTLQSKLVAGTGMTLDYLTTPGSVILNSTPGSVDSFKVKTDVGDPTEGYLGVKIAAGGVSNGVQILPSLDATNHLVVLNATVNPVALFTALIQAAEDDAGLKQLLCNLVATCPSPCNAPTNVEVTYSA